MTPPVRRTMLRAAPVALALALLAACGSTVQTDDSSLQQAGSSLSNPGTVVSNGTVVDQGGQPGAVVTSTLPDGTTVTTSADGGSGAGGTVPDGGLGGSSGGSLPGTTTGGTGTGTTTGPGGTTSTGTGAGTGASGGATTGPGSTSGPGGGSSGGSVPSGGGTVAATGPIEVGITYTGDADAANGALGASSITSGDEKADNQAVIDDINDSGGINGRKLQPVYFAYDATSSAPAASQDQAACSQFTEDNHVSVVLGGGITDTLDSCLQKAGVLSFSAATIIRPDDAELHQFPLRYWVSNPSQERMMADMVSTLKRQSYFSGWDPTLGRAGTKPAKVGVLSLDRPDWSRPLRSTLLPDLAKAGYAVDSSNVYEVPAYSSTTDVGATAAAVQNAVLRFASAGVTHVVILDGSAVLTLLFGKSASSQHYYPRLGFNSGAGAEALLEGSEIGKDSLAGAVGLGWQPLIDVPAAAGAKYATAAQKHCLDNVKKRTGQTFTSANAAGLALGACDSGYLMAADLRAAGSTISTATMVAAMDNLGGKFQPALTPTTFFSGSRHDGAQTGFDMKYDSGCGCVEYVGQHTIP